MRAAGYASSAREKDGAPTKKWLVLALDASEYVREDAGEQP